MLFKILDKIRTKPRQVRDQYAFGIAFTFTAVLVGIWMLSLPARLDNVSDVVSGEEANTTPFSGLITQIKNQFGTAKDSAAAVFQATSSTTVTPLFLAPDSAPEKQNQQPIEIRISSSTNLDTKVTATKTIQISTTTKSQDTDTMDGKSRLPYLETTTP